MAQSITDSYRARCCCCALCRLLQMFGRTSLWPHHPSPLPCPPRCTADAGRYARCLETALLMFVRTSSASLALRTAAATFARLGWGARSVLVLDLDLVLDLLARPPSAPPLCECKACNYPSRSELRRHRRNTTRPHIGATLAGWDRDVHIPREQSVRGTSCHIRLHSDRSRALGG
jgi:hypothetical protein